MTRPRHHPPQTTAEHNAEVSRIRAMLADDDLHQLASEVASDVMEAAGRCPVCGKSVERVNVEPLDYQRQPDGTLASSGVVVVALPCGHSFARE